MPTNDLLLTLLAVSVTFSGFTGIVSIIDRRAAHVSQNVVAWRVRNLNVAVLLVMFLCTLPFVLAGYGLQPQTNMRIACGAAFVVGGLYIIALFRGRSELRKQSVEGFSNTQFNVLIIIGLLIIAALPAGALGLIRPEGTFLVGVFAFVMAVASFFVRLVLMLDESIRNTQ
jgi:hypothetical protein